MEQTKDGRSLNQRRNWCLCRLFDPFTNGHLDIAKRAARLVDELIIAIGHNPSKKGYFSIDERKRLLLL